MKPDIYALFAPSTFSYEDTIQRLLGIMKTYELELGKWYADIIFEDEEYVPCHDVDDLQNESDLRLRLGYSIGGQWNSHGALFSGEELNFGVYRPPGEALTHVYVHVGANTSSGDLHAFMHRKGSKEDAQCALFFDIADVIGSEAFGIWEWTTEIVPLDRDFFTRERLFFLAWKDAYLNMNEVRNALFPSDIRFEKNDFGFYAFVRKIA